MKRILSIIALTFVLSVPAFAQEATPAATVEPTPAPVVEPSTPIETPALTPVLIFAGVMIAASMGGLLYSVYLHVKQTGKVQEGYNMLVQGIVSNAGLTSVLQSGYQSLDADKRRIADLALGLADALSQATVDEQDDVIRVWTARIRDTNAMQTAMKKG